jgi:DNA/RNA-binding domain of Phe-tRNA-synthetase-like protein
MTETHPPLVRRGAASPATPDRFGLVVLEGLEPEALAAAADAARETFPERLAEHLDTARRRVDAFAGHFAAHGHRCPLPGQLDRAARKGLPKILPLVDALLACEMTTGLLMGVQDWSAVRGELVYGACETQESFEGMRGPVTCSPGEPVLQDGEGVIASYFQGPDRRTRVSPETRDAVFFVFTAPGLGAEDVEAGVAAVEALLGEAAATVRRHIVSPPTRP